MATGGKKDKEENEDCSWNMGLAIAGGIAAGLGLVAGAVWQGKKIWDMVTDSVEEEEYSYNEDKIRDSDNLQEKDVGTSRSGEEKPCAIQKSLQSTRPFTTSQNLCKHLEQYYDNFADIDEMAMKQARSVVDEIKTAFWDYVREKLEVEVDMVDIGSASEGLKVVAPDEFDIMIVMDGSKLLRKICYSYPKIEHGTSRLSSDAGGFYFIYLDRVEESTGGWSKLNKWVEVDYGMVSPVKARHSFKKLSDEFSCQYSKYHVTQPASHEGSVMLKVHNYLPGKSLTINFVPAYRIGTDTFVAKPHPKPESDKSHQKLYGLLWRKNFSVVEKELVERMHRKGYTKCLKIFKAIQTQHCSELGNLSSYVYKTLLFHTFDEDGSQWEEEELAEHFIDVIMELQRCLEDGKLLNFFDRDMNLFSSMQPAERERVKLFLKRTIQRQEWRHLLQLQ